MDTACSWNLEEERTSYLHILSKTSAEKYVSVLWFFENVFFKATSAHKVLPNRFRASASANLPMPAQRYDSVCKTLTQDVPP
jgi:hypothetical protein